MRDPIELPTPRTMAKQRSKRYKQAAALVQVGKSYSLTDAISTVKKFPAPKFTPTVTLSFRLGVDPRKSDQMVRGSVSLPHGTGRNVRVAVFAQGAAAEAAIKFTEIFALIKAATAALSAPPSIKTHPSNNFLRNRVRPGATRSDRWTNATEIERIIYYVLVKL